MSKNYRTGILGDPEALKELRRRSSNETGSNDEITIKSERSVGPRSASVEPIQRLPPISEFKFFNLAKPTGQEVRLGQVSIDALNRISNFGQALSGPAPSAYAASSFPSVFTNYDMPYPGELTHPHLQQQVSPALIPPAPYSQTRSHSIVEQQHLAPAKNSHDGEGGQLTHHGPHNHLPHDSHYYRSHPAYQLVPYPRADGPLYPDPVVIQPKSATQHHICKFPGCNKSFPSRSRLTRHEIVHQGLKNFQCLFPNCPKRFSRKDNMLQHYRSHGNGSESSKK